MFAFLAADDFLNNTPFTDSLQGLAAGGAVSSVQSQRLVLAAPVQVRHGLPITPIDPPNFAKAVATPPQTPKPDEATPCKVKGRYGKIPITPVDAPNFVEAVEMPPSKGGIWTSPFD